MVRSSTFRLAAQTAPNGFYFWRFSSTLLAGGRRSSLRSFAEVFMLCWNPVDERMFLLKLITKLVGFEESCFDEGLWLENRKLLSLWFYNDFYLFLYFFVVMFVLCCCFLLLLIVCVLFSGGRLFLTGFCVCSLAHHLASPFCVFLTG